MYAIGTLVTSSFPWCLTGVVEVHHSTLAYHGIRSNTDGHLYWLYPNAEFKPS